VLAVLAALVFRFLLLLLLLFLLLLFYIARMLPKLKGPKLGRITSKENSLTLYFKFYFN
jgi:hypothetical protein